MSTDVRVGGPLPPPPASAPGPDAPPDPPATPARTTTHRSDRADDLALAQAAKLGDRRAFETIVQRHGPAMTRYALRATPDRGEAEDLVQEALVAAWQSLDRFDARSSLRTWLFGILVNKVGTARRKRKALPVEDEQLDRPDHSDPLQAASDSELRRALEAALMTLPDRQRTAWLLVEVEGMTQPEAANVMRTTPDTVRGLLQRARRSLAERMRQWKA